MRVRRLTAVFMLVVLTVVLVVACGAAEKPAERVSPAPQVNRKAVVWRTPEPPSNPEAGDVWVNPKDEMEMVYIPAGKFRLGLSEAEISALKKLDGWYEPIVDPFRDERPQCEVDIPGYWIGRTEVTIGQHRRFIQETGRYSPEYHIGVLPSKGEVSGELPYPGATWGEAQEYCEWAGVRLPTELEWEKAARGPEAWLFPWGDTWRDGQCRMQPPPGHLRGSDFARSFMEAMSPARVRSYRKDLSAYGCYDMAGNLSEWCSDWYTPEAYRRYADGVLLPSAEGSSRVVRGGSYWDQDAHRVRLTVRCQAAPESPPSLRFEITDPDNQSAGAKLSYSKITDLDNQSAGVKLSYIGFRCARDATPVAKSSH